MNSGDEKSLDLLGVKPVAKAIEKTTEGVLASAGAFLSRVCLPVAEEFGLLLKDRVSNWRAINAAKIAARAEQLTEGKNGPIETYPRLAWEIIDRGSWTDDELLQGMWAGLFASSCGEGRDDSNILFSTLLNQLTSIEVRILSYVSETAPKFTSLSGLPYAEDIVVTLPQLVKITGINDLHRLDRELDHLRSLELIDGGFTADDYSSVGTDANIRITTLGLHLFIRGQGFSGSPVGFWSLKPKVEKSPSTEPNLPTKV